MEIRPIVHADISPLLHMLEHSGEFDEDGLAYVNETLAAHLDEGSDAVWYYADSGGFAGVIYCAPEVMANGVWNALMIWIDAVHQRRGVGSALLHRLESDLAEKKARLLMVETSSLEAFIAPRPFYVRQGFTEAARINDYYDVNEDKLIFIKALSRQA